MIEILGYVVIMGISFFAGLNFKDAFMGGGTDDIVVGIKELSNTELDAAICLMQSELKDREKTE